MFVTSGCHNTYTVNNIDHIITLNNERKDWTKKYYKIIRGLETMADIQLQLQNIIWLAKVANTQLVEIETTILQASNTYKIQTSGDIFSISGELWDIIQGDMEKQAHYIQVLLVDELKRCRGKGNEQVETHIKEIQEVYQELPQEMYQLMDINKGKQKKGIVQDEEVFLYKSYNISSEES